MSEQQFIDKWATPEILGTWWGETASRVYWAQAYHTMESMTREMAVDFLSIPFAGTFCASRAHAMRTAQTPTTKCKATFSG